MNKCLYVTGFFHVPGNSKKGLSDYINGLNNLINTLQNNDVIIFTSSFDVEQSVKNLPKKTKERVRLINCNQLDFFDQKILSRNIEIAKDYLEGTNCFVETSPREKLYKHLYRDFSQMTESDYLMLITAWLVKFRLVEYAIQLMPQYASYAWCDATLCRIKGSRSNSNFETLQVKEGFLSVYKSRMTFLGRPVMCNGGFMLASSDIWLKIVKYTSTKIPALLSIYPVLDDEIILSELYYDKIIPINFVGKQYLHLIVLRRIKGIIKNAVFK